MGENDDAMFNTHQNDGSLQRGQGQSSHQMPSGNVTATRRERSIPQVKGENMSFKECKECAEIPDELLRGANARWCSDGHIWIPAVIKTGQYEKSVDIRACDDKVL
jgi:hypothetical protein